MTYKITMLGATLSEPYKLLKAVFPQWNGEPAYADMSYVCVTFETPQTPVDLGPIVNVEVIS